MPRLPNGSNDDNVVVLKRNSEARQSGKFVEIIFNFLNIFPFFIFNFYKYIYTCTYIRILNIH